jgi:spore coat polysaccharide biosynthesis protein SpsF
MHKNIVAIVQARLSSSRFPSKVLAPLAGAPMIAQQLARIKQAQLIGKIIVATSDDASDYKLVEYLQSIDVPFYRGSLNDVLARFHGAAQACNADIVLRLTGDCPLIDADVIDQLVLQFSNGAYAYGSTASPPSYPDGLDVEIMTMAALETAYKEAQLPSEREHVTPYIRNHPERFNALNITGIHDFSHLRWTVDYPDDLQMIENMIAHLKVPFLEADRFDFYRIIEKNPNLKEMNIHTRNEGYAKSLQADV